MTGGLGVGGAALKRIRSSSTTGAGGPCRIRFILSNTNRPLLRCPFACLEPLATRIRSNFSSANDNKHINKQISKQINKQTRPRGAVPSGRADAEILRCAANPANTSSLFGSASWASTPSRYSFVHPFSTRSRPSWDASINTGSAASSLLNQQTSSTLN